MAARQQYADKVETAKIGGEAGVPRGRIEVGAGHARPPGYGPPVGVPGEGLPGVPHH